MPDKMSQVIKQFGFNPNDESWIESVLAKTNREKNWFKFERENATEVVSNDWSKIVAQFNTQYKDQISVEDAKMLSKKRMRYVLGSYNTRVNGNANQSDWEKAATEFEKYHRDRDNRMLTWSLIHKNDFPIARVKKEIVFWCGPYFHQFLEKTPHLFVNLRCNSIKTGVMLRIVAYDPVDKHIRLDFASDIRTLVTGIDNPSPWIKDTSDYEFMLKPEDVELHLDLIGKLS